MRRTGLVLALLLSAAAIPSALDIEADPSTGEVGPLSVIVAVLTCAILVVTIALFLPAWRGLRWATVAIACAQLAGILTALPVFFAPANVVPPGGVILATVGTLVTIAIVAMILSDASDLVLALLAVIVVLAVYAGVVAVGTLIVPASALRLVQTLTAVVIAIAFAPLVLLLRRTVGRALYGGRVEPAATALRIGRRVLDGTDALTAALDEAAAALRLPRIELVDGQAVIASGTSGQSPEDATADVPLGAGEGFLLRVTLRRGERSLHRDDRAALALIAPPLVLLARESALLAQVRAARASLADTREREQLSLHRDLHDGLGPLLTGAVMRADAARNLLTTDDVSAAEQLDASRADLRTAIAEVRRVVYGLWPVELEQRGLGAAIAARARAAGIDVTVPSEVPPLPPAVELAAYRIACEAIANVERHSPGSSASLHFAISGKAAELVVTNATEFSTPGDRRFPHGMGLTSMQQRAEELGGSVEAGPVQNGWSVIVRLPYDTELALPPTDGDGS
nr:histidine kinase [Planctomonas sp. JC2975]